jgi:heat shock protein HslJ
MRTPLLHLPMCAALMLTSCINSPSPEDMQRRAEKNRWELAHWGDRRLPHGDHGEPVVLSFKGGKVWGHAGCNQYSAEIAFGPDRGSLKVYPGITTRMACDASRMEFESAFIQAFETSTRYRLEGESLFFQGANGPPLEFYRRPLDGYAF